jgi:hypothetical protein
LFNPAVDGDDGNPWLRGRTPMALAHWQQAMIAADFRSREVRSQVVAERVADVMISALARFRDQFGSRVI